jgi:prepilin-type N-terminal cleavage/methylation domain-containing protein
VSAPRHHRPWRRRRYGPNAVGDPRGFTLLELLLALALGLVFCGGVLQVLLLQGRQGALLVRQVRERSFQRRALEVLRWDLQRAEQVRIGEASGAPCSLGGREPVLLISTAEGPILYTVGPAPSLIWRGLVLMRCGPAFGLDGEPSLGAAQNRVLLDGLAQGGLGAEAMGTGWLRLRLEQRLPLLGGGSQRIATSVEVAAQLDF